MTDVRNGSLRWSRQLVIWLSVGIGVTIVTLALLDRRATREWRRSSQLLMERRADEAAELLATALTRDMRGAQTSILMTLHREDLALEAPYDVINRVASAFARYPYPESFFAWRPAADADVLYFNRASRQPPWMARETAQSSFPVSVVRDAPFAPALLERIRADALLGRRFTAFERRLGDASYQVVARLLYRDPLREEFDGVVGFTVNLSWIRESYFPEFTRQIARISGADDSLRVAVLDDEDQTVTSTQAVTSDGPVRRRRLPLLFCDPALVPLHPPPDLSQRYWTVEVAALSDPALQAAVRGADRALIVMTMAACALGLGLILTARAVWSSAELAGLRSDFVSTVTHELKTPLATIRAMSETLAYGRIASAEAQHEYAQLLVQEARRLTRLVDNLLAYARVTDPTDIYAFEPLAIFELVDEAVQRFRPRLLEKNFDVQIDIPDDLPQVRGDRTALALMLDNLIDNALTYSTHGRFLGVTGCRQGDVIRLEVIDRGNGIPPDELGQVRRKFFRGRLARSGGSGLGLAIVDRVVRNHGGTLEIHSQVGAGTRMVTTLPVVEA